MFARLEEIEKKYDEITELLSNPEIFSDQAAYQKNAKAQAAIAEIVEGFREYKEIFRQLKDAQALLEEELDSEMREFAQSEIDELQNRKEEYEEKLKILLLPKDPNDEKTLLWKSEREPEGKKLRFLPGISIKCIPGMPKNRAGKRKCSAPVIRISVGLKKLSLWLRDGELTVC